MTRAHQMANTWPLIMAARAAMVAWLLLMLTNQAHGDALADPDWLATRLSDPAVQVIDARPAEAYAAGHVRGALSLPVDATFDSGERDGLLAGVSTIRELFSSAGIRDDSHLVLYDDGGFVDAARLLWVFEVFGQARVSILNIGYPGWVSRGLPHDRAQSLAPRSDYLPRIQPQHMATALSTRVAMDNEQVVIIDARAEEEYLGEQTIASRAGHIPGAVNVPWDRNIEQGPNGPQLVLSDRLAAEYRALIGDRKVIAYCNKGKQSALTYFVLRNLGYDAAAYDGSWQEWGNRTSLPVAVPKPSDAPH